MHNCFNGKLLMNLLCTNFITNRLVQLSDLQYLNYSEPIKLPGLAASLQISIEYINIIGLSWNFHFLQFNFQKKKTSKKFTNSTLVTEM